MVIAFIPKAIFTRLGLSGTAGWHANVVTSHALLLGFLLTPALAYTDIIPHDCLIKNTFGVPCPGCGVTTCLRESTAGEIRRAAAANPAGLGLLAGLVIQVGLHGMALRWSDRSRMAIKYSDLIGRVVLGSLLLVWLCRIVPNFQ